MANFDGLNATVAGLGTALDEAVTRISADMQALRDALAEAQLDAADQEAVDAIVARVQAQVDRLDAIDPDPNNPTIPPAPEPQPEPGPGPEPTPGPGPEPEPQPQP